MALLTDGHPTRVSGASITIFGTQFKEKDVTPPGVMGGGANDTTTMRNTRWRTKQPKKLATLDQMTVTVAYDPAAYTTIVSQLQVNQVITITWPDGHTLAFWGWLDGFKPNQMREGEQPTAVATFECSNQDNSGAEQAPVET